MRLACQPSQGLARRHEDALKQTLFIELEDDPTSNYAALLAEQPELLKTIKQAAFQILQTALERQRRISTYLQGATLNGNLDCGVIAPLRKPEPDPLQIFVEANRRDDKAVGARPSVEVERLLDKETK
jgi:hypothetical protein